MGAPSAYAGSEGALDAGAVSDAGSLANRMNGGPRWVWFHACGGPTLRLEVRLDGEPVFATEFPVCRLLPGDIPDAVYEPHLTYSFVVKRDLEWLGYRDDNPVTRAGQSVSGTLWLAGSEADVLYLGVDFFNAETKLYNTLAFADPGKAAVYEYQKGLTVSVAPVPQPRKKTGPR
jgi:hypothetical protein